MRRERQGELRGNPIVEIAARKRINFAFLGPKRRLRQETRCIGRRYIAQRDRGRRRRRREGPGSGALNE